MQSASSQPRTVRSGQDFVKCCPRIETTKLALKSSTKLSSSFVWTTQLPAIWQTSAAIFYAGHITSRPVNKSGHVQIGGTTRCMCRRFIYTFIDLLNLASNYCLCRWRCRYQLWAYRSRRSYRSQIRGGYLYRRPHASCPFHQSLCTNFIPGKTFPTFEVLQASQRTQEYVYNLKDQPHQWFPSFYRALTGSRTHWHNPQKARMESHTRASRRGQVCRDKDKRPHLSERLPGSRVQRLRQELYHRTWP